MNYKALENEAMMNECNVIPDVQNTPDTRHIAIQKVGVRNVRHPVVLQTREGAQPTVGTWTMTVRLPETKKGTHMSRFIYLLEKLNASNEPPFTLNRFRRLITDMVSLLESDSGSIELSFPFFMRKHAPVTGEPSLMDYEVAVSGTLDNGKVSLRQRVVVPVTSLCPCSKEISEYGAHNQRSHITVDAKVDESLSIEELIELIEQQASCELFGLLKRPDEKYVTERAYDNPKFVEDLARDVACVLNADGRIYAYTLEVENFESIHNHSAYAYLEFDKENP